MKPLPAKLWIEKGYCVTPNLHKKCVIHPNNFRAGLTEQTYRQKRQDGKHQKSIFHTTRTWKANYAFGILFSLLTPLFVYTLPTLLVSISSLRLYLLLHNINTFSHLPTSLYTPFQSLHKLYSYLCTGQLFMEGCKLLAHHGRIWYPAKLMEERKRCLKVAGVMARPSNEIGTGYSDSWFDRIAIQHLSKSVQATTGNVMYLLIGVVSSHVHASKILTRQWAWWFFVFYLICLFLRW